MAGEMLRHAHRRRVTRASPQRHRRQNASVGHATDGRKADFLRCELPAGRLGGVGRGRLRDAGRRGAHLAHGAHQVVDRQVEAGLGSATGPVAV